MYFSNKQALCKSIKGKKKKKKNLTLKYPKS